MRKKVIVFGGGHGANYFLKGLKEFPLDIVAVISVSDNGRSTGKLRNEFNMPAMGDIRNVIVSLSNIDNDLKESLQYRFHTNSDLNGHPLGNLILASMYQKTGSFKKSIDMFSTLVNLKHKVLPLSEDYLTLMGETIDGEIVEGECNLPLVDKKYKRIFYKENPTVLQEVLDEIEKADAIIFSMGSLYTSIIPHLLCPQIIDALKNTKKEKIYICNAVTQPGETDDYTVSDHVKELNKYLKYSKIDAVVVANTKISEKIVKKYSNEEQKSLVKIDKKNLDAIGCKLIKSDMLFIDEDNYIRHDSIKLATTIFSYLMR